MDLHAARVAEAAGGRLLAGDPQAPGPRRAVLDSRAIGEGDLFVGLPGVSVDGGEFAERALEAGAWGVLVGDAHATDLDGGVVIAAADPLAALQSLARTWRRELGCPVIGVTGSTGKTSTKDILAALLRPHLRTHANREKLLAEHLRDDLSTVTFGDGGGVHLVSFENGHARIAAEGDEVELELPFSEPYNVGNTLAAVAAARAVGVQPSGAVDVRFSSLRGELVELEGGVAVVNDCYNANPMSMRAALDYLAEAPAQRRIAVLGWMAELGPDAERFHREIGEHARARGIDLLIPVGDDAARLYSEGFGGPVDAAADPEDAGRILGRVAKPGDRVLIKGSRSAGLERVLR